jgi:hypothetical protein
LTPKSIAGHSPAIVTWIHLDLMADTNILFEIVLNNENLLDLLLVHQTGCIKNSRFQIIPFTSFVSQKTPSYAIF